MIILDLKIKMSDQGESSSGGCYPGSSCFSETVANAISDDDVINEPANDFMAAYYYYESASLQSEGKLFKYSLIN